MRTRWWSWAGLIVVCGATLAAARIVASEHGGRIPRNYDALIALPGIGEYMAGAILSIVDIDLRKCLDHPY